MHRNSRSYPYRAHLIASFLGSAILLIASIGHAAEVTLAWDANSESSLAGYKIYYGESSGIYSEEIDVGNTTQTTITGLQEGRAYYFAATAYDTDGIESDFSDETVHTLQAADSDGDGLSDADESAYYGTDPHNPDTDGDGIDDGAEVDYWNDAWNLDADGDGIINLLDSDADNDGISDGAELSDGSDPSDPIDTNPVNDSPVTNADSYETASGESLLVDAATGVLANDVDPEGDPLTAVLIDLPTNGALTLHSDGAFSYTPSANFSGTDRFTYAAADSLQQGDTATVTLQVNGTAGERVREGIVALYDFSEGMGLTVHDTSEYGTSLDLTIANDSSVEWISGGGLKVHSPTAIHSTGSASKISNALKNSGEITLEAWVTPANASQYGPARIVALSGDAYPTGGNFVLGVGVSSKKTATYDVRLRTTATNQYGMPSLTSANGSLTTTLTHVVYTKSTAGEAKLYLNGTQVSTASINGNFSNWGNYALGLANEPDPSRGDRPWLGTLHLVAIYRRALSQEEIIANLDAGSKADINQVPIAAADNYNLNEDEVLTVSSGSGVLANDSDPDGDSLLVYLTAHPSNGVLTLNTDGSFEYNPDPDFSGSDKFDYRIEDGHSGVAHSTVRLDVKPVNDIPVCTWDEYQANQDKVLTVNANDGVLANDADPDGDDLIAILVGGSGPSKGSLKLNPDGSFQYTPFAGHSGTDQFSYQAEDPAGQKASATVKINIVSAPDNQPPVTNADSYTVTSGESLTVETADGVLQNDSDPEGDTLEALLVGLPTYGALTLQSDGSFVYTPNTGFSGTDSFTYAAVDNHQQGNNATVSLHVEEPVTQRAEDGLIAFYDFSEGAGNIVNDNSGYGTPLNLTIADGSAVQWMAGGGLKIHSSTAIHSSGAATKITDALKTSGELTLEAWVIPANVTQYGPARIIALSGDAYPTGGNFVLGAGVSSNKTATYDVRLRTTATNQYGMPSLTSANGALTASLTHVVYTKTSGGETRLYLNGALAATGSIAGNFSNWGNYALSLGNEPDPSLGDRPWLGTLHLAAIYSRALNQTEVGLNYQAGTSKP